MTMATSWSYVPTDVYKPARELVHLLVDIVAKGGNLLLNIGPSPEGELPAESLKRLAELGEWMKVNGKAVYGTRPIAPYKEGSICFTRNKDGTLNAIYLSDEVGNTPPAELRVSAFSPEPGSVVRMLGVTQPLSWEATDGSTVIKIPKSVRNHPPSRYAWTITFTPKVLR
jgi:alpha-L-fucosidase